MSEKLDGVRAMWTGTEFVTRGGNRIDAPDWRFPIMPNCRLDGELWGGRGTFSKTNGTCRMKNDGSDRYRAAWKAVTFQVFDAPDHPGSFESRYQFLQRLIPASTVAVLNQTRCEDNDHLAEWRDGIWRDGGEGIMLREPGSLYVGARSDTLLRIKPDEHEEATVIGHNPGTGRNAAVLGALVVRLDDGIECKVGSGIPDNMRLNPPAIGSRVSFRFKGRTERGIPRHACEPTMVGVRP